MNEILITIIIGIAGLLVIVYLIRELIKEDKEKLKNKIEDKDNIKN